VVASAVLGLGFVGFVSLQLVKSVRTSRHPHRLVPPPPGTRLGSGAKLMGSGSELAALAAQEPSDEEEAITKLHLELTPNDKCSLQISMGSVVSIDDLQELVADVCEEAGYAELDDLVMAYKRPDGEYSTVTRSVTVAMLKASPALRLAPAPPSAKKAKQDQKAKHDQKSRHDQKAKHGPKGQTRPRGQGA